jgi:carbonic anhydrase
MRDFSPAALLAVAFALAGWGLAQTPALVPSRVELPEPRTPDEALALVRDGNRRFADGRSARPHGDSTRAHALAAGQKPPVVVLACADSRVSPEIVLDQGLGDLFVIRVAGNVLEPSIVGSIEYSVEHLGSKLVLVLGHSSCGGVKAALAAHGKPEAAKELGPNLAALVAHIEPALAHIPAGTPESDRVAAAVRENAALVARELPEQSKILEEAIHSGKVAVVAAVYHLDTGEVEFLR